MKKLIIFKVDTNKNGTDNNFIVTPISLKKVLLRTNIPQDRDLYNYNQV